ncbi:M23 family metallopeptidase [Candidatus Arthromitus sp. SFB-rat-Yit]|uniref:M23 family metallopeptidase n=1 Tax=Candidatus Arthromitus sp. SFB-rat-Yit TaxID=1041504 RepID=UPI000227A46B|nr:M23 family metallopeptidase [Candidatus Arthromitus sp. SFB-rat-Yit]BAK80942.1 peptidase, M23/M37 family protein [Candidatus Arthromitus sp. SFB-rat-Yit]
MFKFKNILIKFIIFCMCLNLFGASEDTFKQEINKNNKKIRELYESDVKFNTEMDLIQKKLLELSQEIDKKQRIVEEYNKQIELTEQNIYDANKNIENLNNEINELEDVVHKNLLEIQKYEEDIKKFKQVIDNRLRNLYKNIDTYTNNLIRIFYTSENVIDCFDKILSMNKFLEIDRIAIEKFANNIEQINVKNENIKFLKALIEEKIKLVNKTISENNDNLKNMEYQKDEKQKQLNDINELNVQLNEQYESLSEDKKQIQQEIIRIQEDNVKLQNELKNYMEELNKNNKEAKKKVKYGRYLKPVNGKITSRFGKRIHPVTGKESSHTGLDIAAPLGEKVKASLGGEVVFSGWYSNVYGNVVIINHGNNIQTFYGHLSKVLVKKGEEVDQGDVIGKVGNTGLSTGPHLHFEIYVNGERVDPEKRIFK